MKGCPGKYSIVLIIWLAITASSLSGQSEPAGEKAGEAPEVNPSSSGADNHAFYAGIGGGSNLVYLGTSLSNNKPFYAASVTYGYRNTIFASVSATHLTSVSPWVAFSNLSLNYSHAFNSWFDISAGMAGYNTAESLQDSLFSDFAYLNITPGFDWNILYTRISFSGILSQQNGFYLQVSNSRYFETPQFLKGRGQVSFNPDIDVLFGNFISMESATGNKNYGKSPPFGHGNNMPGSNEKYSEKLGLLDIEFSLPISFSYGKFSLEATPAYILPVYSSPFYPMPEGFTFYLNLFLKII